MTRLSPRFLCVALCGLLSLAVLRTAAAAPGEADDGCLREPQCRAHYDTALDHYEAGRYAAALPEFQAAYAMRQMPWLLINIGRTLQRLGRQQEAINYYERYQAANPHGDPETTKKVNEYLAQARIMLGAPAAPTTPPPPPPPPKPTKPPVEQNLTTLPPTVSEQPGTDVAKPPPATEEAPKPIYKKWWFWTIIGGAVAVTVIGVAAGTAGKGDLIPGDATVYKPTF